MKPIKTLTLTAMALAFSQAFGQTAPGDSVGAYAYWALPPGSGTGVNNNITVFYDGKSLVFKENVPGGKENYVNPQLALPGGTPVQAQGKPPADAKAFDWNGFVAVNNSFFGTNTNALGNIGYNVTVSPTSLNTTVPDGYGGQVTVASPNKNGTFVGTAVLNGKTVSINRSNDLSYGGYGGSALREGFYGGQPGIFKVYTSASADQYYGSYIEGQQQRFFAPDSVPVSSYLSVGRVNFNDPSRSFSAFQASYVSGVATTAAQMASVVASLGNVSAIYTGNSLLTNLNVAMSVNFGASTWSGSFTYGGSTNVYQSNGSGAYFNPSFSASGTISGANFSGNAATFTPSNNSRSAIVYNTVSSGTVNGNFVGPAAQGLIGQASVNFSGVPSYGSVTFKDAFWALKGDRRP